MATAQVGVHEQMVGELIGNRYQLHERLGSGGMGGVYRATDRLTKATIALKRVTVTIPPESGGSTGSPDDYQLALAREFRLLASLRHPNIISVLDYGFDEARQPYFTMTYLEDAQNIIRAGRDGTVDEKIDLLIQLLQAVAYLHRRGILHRDLKPSNVLVVDGQVKILDFGLAVAHEHAIGMVGTAAYIAPELIQLQPATRRSDLYAVGIIAFELLGGEHPFDLEVSLLTLVKEILNGVPLDMHLPVNPMVEAVVRRLAHRNPAQRYSDPQSVIEDLNHATGRPIAAESRAIRESFLQAATFVGRQAEMDRLVGALKDVLRAIKHGREGGGSAWLVGGESGVGKSRLLEEIRTRAMVEGALVVVGQAVAEGGAPYQAWREVVRRLLLSTGVEDGTASVLKEIVPDIEELIGRPVSEAAPLDAEAGQKRLVGAIVRLFRQQRQPLVVVLEDLQWLAESLLPLRELSVLASQLPVLMIGSYRDDERPHLPEKLPDMRVLKLERLNDEHIRELSVAMLGQAGRRRPVQELLRRETEGNVFFVVEVLRTLAEDLGGLHEVGRAELPPEIFSASIQEFIERRLARVPADYRPLLRLAAVAGRTIDVPVIARLLEMLPDTPFATGMEATFSLEEWLFGCADVAVLEHKNETWRFSHDKLREAARDTLSAALIPAAHRLIAAAIESVQSDLGVQATPLAFHWGRAGEAEKEYEYSVLAGQRALQSGANEQAAGLLRRALELVSRGQVALATVMEEFRLHIWLGTALMATRGWGSKEVRDVYRRARELAPRVGAGEELFSVLWGLWAAHLLRDEGQAMTVLAGQLMEVAQDADDDDLRLEAHLALGVTRRHQGQHETASAYLEQVVAAYDRQAHADHSFRFGQDPAVVAYSLAAGELWLMGYADQAREQLRHGMNLAEALGYPFNVAYNLVEWARLMQMMGDRGQTLKWARRVIELSEQHSFPMMLAIGRVLRGWAMDEVAGERRIKETQHGLILLHLTGAKYAYPHYLGCLADVYAQTGKVDAAVALVDEALEVVHQAPFYEAELLRLKGEFLRKATGEHDAEAAYLFEQALRTAESRGQVAWVLRALLSWYRLLAASGRGAGLRSRLREAYRWFSEGFDTPDLQAVRAIVTREEGE